MSLRLVSKFCLLEKKLILAQKYFDNFLYSIFCSDRNKRIKRKYFNEFQHRGKLLITKVPNYLGLDLMIYDYKLKLLNNEVVEKRPFLCLCPYDQESKSVRQKLFGDLPIPSLMRDTRNNLMCRHIYQSSICSEDAMCIDYFCQHIDETIEDQFCLDHLAIKCYLLAVHGPYLSLRNSLSSEAKKNIFEQYYSIYMKRKNE